MATTLISDNSKLANTISVNLKTEGGYDTAAGKIAENLAKLEHQLMDLYSQASKATDAEQAKIQGDIATAQFKYQRAMRVYEGLQTLMKNMHEMFMRGIQNIRTN